MSKQTRGDGGIRKRSDGRWEARIVTGIDPGTGKAIRRSVFGKTQKECRQKLNEIRSKLDAGTYQAPGAKPVTTLGEWLDRWLTDYIPGTVKQRTVEIYRQQITQHIKPALGAVKLTDLTKDMVQAFIKNLHNTKTGEPLAPKSKKLIHGTLHAALAQAVESKHISDNPATRVRLPKQEKREPVVVDGDDLKAYLSAIQGHQYEIPLTLYLFTGMRKNELLGLQWRDIDWEAGTITIARQIYIPRGGGKPEAAPVKNGKPRVIAPASFVMDMLRRQQHEQEQQRMDAGEFWNESDWVFTREDGQPLSPTNIYKALKRVAAKISLPEAGVHDLRHPYVKPKTQIFRNIF